MKKFFLLFTLVLKVQHAIAEPGISELEERIGEVELCRHLLNESELKHSVYKDDWDRFEITYKAIHSYTSKKYPHDAGKILMNGYVHGYPTVYHWQGTDGKKVAFRDRPIEAKLAHLKACRTILNKKVWANTP